MLSLCSTHLVPPLLRRAFQDQALLSELPPDVLEFLDAVYALNLESNLRYEDQLTKLVETLNIIGVRPVLLKGAAALVGGLYPTPGERMIGDIDILIPPSKLAQAVAQLYKAGYQPVDAEKDLLAVVNYYPKAHHCPRIYSLDWPVPVELHSHPIHLWAAQLLGAEEVVRDATPLNWRGASCFLPSPTHFVMQNIIHAFVVDFKDRGFLSLRQLFEFVLASQTYADRIDWAAIRRRFESLGYGSALRRYGGIANAYLGCQTPPPLIGGRLPALRHWFYRVQLEHPAIHFLVSLGRLLRLRVWVLASHPHRMKNLFDVQKYIRLYKL